MLTMHCRHVTSYISNSLVSQSHIFEQCVHILTQYIYFVNICHKTHVKRIIVFLIFDLLLLLFIFIFLVNTFVYYIIHYSVWLFKSFQIYFENIILNV
ncbi:unknown [Neodiprion lecontei nucleopolyhedrovirus]|uniref:Uncharacterized protein n=1 Tax=Neodiprion lecontei nucleopolyhedrovirus (strain Canada) TaxID=654906 RepID=Q6JP94_NPVNC|nr:unknown [Neodiprion lecontei nucleopolyhedrovirus]AAQ99118.1 unknown [Neodiprion lecontei nucleopolyhedrovirus]